MMIMIIVNSNTNDNINNENDKMISNDIWQLQLLVERILVKITKSFLSLDPNNNYLQPKLVEEIVHGSYRGGRSGNRKKSSG